MYKWANTRNYQRLWNVDETNLTSSYISIVAYQIFLTNDTKQGCKKKKGNIVKC